MPEGRIAFRRGRAAGSARERGLVEAVHRLAILGLAAWRSEGEVRPARQGLPGADIELVGKEMTLSLAADGALAISFHFAGGPRSSSVILRGQG